MQTRPLSKHIGEMIENKHIADFTDSDIVDLKRLLFYRKAVFLEDQFLTKRQQLELGHKLKTNPDSILIDQDIDNSKVYNYGETWHSDRDYSKSLPTYTIFQINKLPSNTLTGSTEFADMVALYNYGISKALRETLKNLTATHEHIALEKVLFESNSEHILGRRIFQSIHPIVLQTKFDNEIAESLLISPAHVTRINELHEDESNAILDALYSKLHLYTEFHYLHRWKEGSIVIWDNRLCTHRGLKDFNPGDVRLASRVVVH